MSEFLTLLVSGAAGGAIFSIMGLGIVLTYETTGIFNFAHGAVAFVCAFLFYELHTGQHVGVLPAAIITIGVFAPLLGLILNKVMLKQLASSSMHARVVGTIGLFVALPNLALWIVEQVNAEGGHLPTATEIFTAPGLGPTPAVQWTLMHGLVVNSDQVAILAAALVSGGLLWLLLRRTRLGLLLRADVDRRELAVLRGIDSNRVSAVTWVLTMMLAALGGCLLAPLFGMDDITFTLVVLGSFAAIVFGRLRSLPLVFAGGLLLGIVQDLVAGYGTDFLPGFLTRLSGFRTSIPFILAIGGLIALSQLQGRRGPTASSEPPPRDYLRGLPVWRRIAPWAVTGTGLVVYVLGFADAYWAGLIAQGVVLAIVFLSFVVVTGMGGMVSLAQASFVTAGAFVAGWVLKHQFSSTVPILLANGRINFALAVFIAALVAAAAGALVALPVRRLGALELALATLSIALVADQVIFQLNSVRNGSDGYLVNPPSIGSIHFSDQRSLVILLLIVFGILTLLVRNLRESATGRSIYASRSSDRAARTVGLSPDRAKILVFAVSAGIAGVGGAFYSVVSSPFTNTTTPAFSGLIWLAVVVTLGVRRPAGAFLAGMTYGVGNALLTKATAHSGLFHSLVSSSHFLPILFGLGAINLAKNPDGAMALTVQRIRERRRTPQTDKESGATFVEAPISGVSPGGPVLDLTGIAAGYGEVEVLHGVSLSVRAGSVTALLGSNGAGKSTICRVVAGLLPAVAGSVVFAGEDVTSWPAHRRAKGGLLLAPEARGVFPGLSVDENLAVWLRTTAERHEAYERFPILAERRSQLAGLLSGGEQQMLALAGALVRPPVLLVADEPTLGLAPMVAKTVRTALKEISARGTAVLLVEEKMAAVSEFADAAAVMRSGRIVWSGTMGELNRDFTADTYFGETGASPIAAEKGVT